MDSIPLRPIAQRLRAIREDADRTQADTAAALGIPLRTYRRYDSGDSEPQIGFLVQFCQLFGCSADYILGLSDERPDVSLLRARFRRDPLDDLTDEQRAAVYAYARFLRADPGIPQKSPAS